MNVDIIVALVVDWGHSWFIMLILCLQSLPFKIDSSCPLLRPCLKASSKSLLEIIRFIEMIKALLLFGRPFSHLQGTYLRTQKSFLMSLKGSCSKHKTFLSVKDALFIYSTALQRKERLVSLSVNSFQTYLQGWIILSANEQLDILLFVV